MVVLNLGALKGVIVAAKMGSPAACERRTNCLYAAMTRSPMSCCAAVVASATPMSFTPSKMNVYLTPGWERTSRSKRPMALGPRPSARIRFPPAAWFPNARVLREGSEEFCRRARRRSGQRLFALSSLPRPSVIESPTNATVRIDVGTHASRVLMKYL